MSSIGRLTPVITSTCALDERHRQVGRRSAEHVGQHEHVRGVVAGVARRHQRTRCDRPADLLPRLIDVVVPPDRHGGEVRQIADDHLGRVHQLGGQLPVRDDDDAEFHVASLILTTAEPANSEPREPRTPSTSISHCQYPGA